MADLLPEIEASHARIKKLQTEFDETNSMCALLETSNAGLREQIEQQGNLALELQQSRSRLPDLIQQVDSLKAAEKERAELEATLKQEEARLAEAKATLEVTKAPAADGAGATPASGLFSSLARSFWSQSGKADTPVAKQQLAEIEEIEKETVEWKEKALKLEQELAELTKARDAEGTHASSQFELLLSPESQALTLSTSVYAGASDYSADPTSSGRPPSSAGGFDDAGGAATGPFVPDQRTQTLLDRLRDTVKTLKTKIQELQEEENALRADNSECHLATAARRWSRAGVSEC